MVIEKAFNSLHHNFLISTLEKYGFGQNFILWVKILLKDQESCVINGGKLQSTFRLVDELIRLFLIKKFLGSSFKFHSNVLREIKSSFFPYFYRDIFLFWKKHLTRKHETPSCILSPYLWYNGNIQVDSIYLVRFFEKNINYVSQLFRPDSSIKKWHELKTEHKLHENSYLLFMTITLPTYDLFSTNS